MNEFCHFGIGLGPNRHPTPRNYAHHATPRPSPFERTNLERSPAEQAFQGEAGPFTLSAQPVASSRFDEDAALALTSVRQSARLPSRGFRAGGTQARLAPQHGSDQGIRRLGWAKNQPRRAIAQVDRGRSFVDSLHTHQKALLCRDTVYTVSRALAAGTH
jgi:hypothetical protein